MHQAVRGGILKHLAIALLLVLTCRGAFAAILEGRVVGVTDGDTVTVLDGERKRHKIRLGGIDAPEDGQPFGKRSKENLSDMVFGKDVRVEWKKRDKYKRIVGKVWVQPESCPTCPMTLDAGHAQVTVGLAWWYRKYAREQSPGDRGAYEFSEQEARAKRVGLWSEPDPLPPWEWRRSSKGTQPPKSKGMINAGGFDVEPLYGLNIRGIVSRPDDQ